MAGMTTSPRHGKAGQNMLGPEPGMTKQVCDCGRVYYFRASALAKRAGRPYKCKGCTIRDRRRKPC